MLYMREYVDIFDSINNYLCTKKWENYAQVQSMENTLTGMIYDL